MKKRILLVACASILLTFNACGAVETGQITESTTESVPESTANVVTETTENGEKLTETKTDETSFDEKDMTKIELPEKINGKYCTIATIVDETKVIVRLHDLVPYRYLPYPDLSLYPDKTPVYGTVEMGLYDFVSGEYTKILNDSTTSTRNPLVYAVNRDYVVILHNSAVARDCKLSYFDVKTNELKEIPLVSKCMPDCDISKGGMSEHNDECVWQITTKEVRIDDDKIIYLMMKLEKMTYYKYSYDIKTGETKLLSETERGEWDLLYPEDVPNIKLDGRSDINKDFVLIKNHNPSKDIVKEVDGFEGSEFNTTTIPGYDYYFYKK
jgi:hypothetical protein